MGDGGAVADAAASQSDGVESAPGGKAVTSSNGPATTPLTLGAFLELLDGVVEMPGRMLIMTTNHPERLDPALVRPGRVDVVVRFGRLLRADVRRLFELWFGAPMPDAAYERLVDGRWTQAELCELFTRAGGCAEAALDAVVA
jgi:SpoVK/Ycf46/Vps4 family AAA+-type ATPase